GRAERRRHLGRFERAQTAAGTGAHEDDPAVLAQRLRDDVDADRDALFLPLDRREHLPILFEHFLDDVGYRLLVDGARRGIDGLRWTRLILGRDGQAGTPRDDWPILSQPPMIDAYLDHLRVERRLADHTVESYARDLAALGGFADRVGCEAAALDRAALERF